MKNLYIVPTAALLLFINPLSHAKVSPSTKTTRPVLSDIQLLKESGIKVLEQDKKTGVGYALVTPEQEKALSLNAHKKGKCGGFEALPQGPQVLSMGEQTRAAQSILKSLRQRVEKDQAFVATMSLNLALEKRAEIESAVSQVSEQNLKNWVQWFSAYPTRYNRAETANEHVVALKQKLEAMLSNADFPTSLETIDHSSTRQKSLRVRLTGSQQPNEIVVMGGHMDSINQSWRGRGKKAPGADDNASGSSNLIEALRILLEQGQPQRTVEIMWYAGEESGLLGSAEIAKSYKASNKNVVGVLQLDMTLHPGSGEFTLASMTDFTSQWLRSYFVELNRLYIGAKIVEDRCGYGCSDHASWYRQGYPTLMPFESTMNRMNRKIHTKNDVIHSGLSFEHSAMFAKIAVAFAMDLANSNLKQPY